jgi:hypothetical protein
MFCPECGAEYRPQFTECAECGVHLVATLPPEEAPTPDVKLVAVFETTDAALLPVVRSLLDSENVEYSVQGEEALGLLPVGAMGRNVSLNRASLGAVIYVAEHDAEWVKHLLSTIDNDFPDLGPAGEAEDA